MISLGTRLRDCSIFFLKLNEETPYWKDFLSRVVAVNLVKPSYPWEGITIDGRFGQHVSELLLLSK